MTPELNDDVGATLVEIVDLKTKAKNRRDASKFDRALKYLDRAVHIAEDLYDRSPMDFAPELADIYGMVGGIRRRQADESAAAGDDPARHDHLRQSHEAYDRGFEYENEDLGVVDSYNLVNRLVSRILAQPAVLAGEPLQDERLIPDGTLLDELERALQIVDKQLDESRRGDVWAMADHALLSLLISKDAMARTAYGPLHSTAPPSYVYGSALSTLRPLADVGSDLRPELAVAVRDLESRMGRPG